MKNDGTLCCYYCVNEYFLNRRTNLILNFGFSLFPSVSKLTDHIIERHFKECDKCKRIITGDWFKHHAMHLDEERYPFPKVKVHGEKKLEIKKKLWIKQNKGECYRCGAQLGFTKKSIFPLAIMDHNHYTGEIRGLCCRACNALLGRIEAG